MEQRFLSKVNKTDTCWLWTANKNEDGYGAFYFNKKDRKAHRVAYELWNGEIPADMCVRHTCDEPSCVNPAHLLVGTHTENMRDKVERGRQRTNPPLGENHKLSKITDDEVREIRVLRGFYSQTELGKMYNISKSQVYRIYHKKNWKHII